MSITAVTLPFLARAASGRRLGSVAGFAVPADGVADAPQAAPVAASGLDGLLALQEAEGAVMADRAARQHADQLMAGLGRLQRALLGDGAGSAAALADLAALSRHAPRAADPRLAMLVRAVSVRAAVEIARRAPPPETAAMR